MKTVLLITARFDPTADLLLTELRRRDVPCVRWNTYEFPLESALTYRATNHGFAAEIVSDGRMVDLDTVGSVWWQWDQPGGFPADLVGAERRFAEAEAQLALTALVTGAISFGSITPPANGSLCPNPLSCSSRGRSDWTFPGPLSAMTLPRSGGSSSSRGRQSFTRLFFSAEKHGRQRALYRPRHRREAREPRSHSLDSRDFSGAYREIP